jgi:putrescine transport system permease protein
MRRFAAVLPPYAWLALFFLVPFLIVLKISLADQAMGIPPYTPLIADGRIQASGANYQFLFSDSLYARAYLNAIWFALWSTVGCLLIGYPLAYAIVRAPLRWRDALLLLVILPFWTSFLIRVYAWIGLLKGNGLINNLLMQIGLIHAPLPLINNSFAVFVGLIYSYLPYMVLPLYAALFIPMCGEFIIPDLLGGPDTLMIGHVLWDEFFTNRDWPLASAVAVAMLVLLVLPMALLRRYLTGERA